MPYISENFITEDKKTAVALGNFDGLHCGHMAVIRAAIDGARQEFVPVMLKFNEHPSRFLDGKPLPMLLTAEQEQKKLHLLGVKMVYYRFPDVRNLSPREFVEKVLVRELHAGLVTCGFNYHFAAGAAGNAELLSSLCQEYGIACRVCPQVLYNGTVISSSEIRKALLEGEIGIANRMLGYLYSYDHVVVEGDRRGRLLGAPTINQFFPAEALVPKYGVYASIATVNGKQYAAVTNIGLRPTIGHSVPRSETFIEGFSGDLYGKRPMVSLLEYMRPEMKFDSLEALGAQIAADARKAAQIAGV